MGAVTQQAGASTPIIAAGTTQVYTGTGVILGFFVSSGTSVSVTIYDNTTTTGNPILAAFIAPANGWYAFPSGFGTGLRVVVGGTTPQITLVWAVN